MPTFRELLRSADGPVVGTFVKIPALEVAEILGEAGFDFVVIDTEHALLSVRDVYALLVVYSRMGVAPLVRITDHGYGDAQRYLDAGAAGILVPHVSNAAQAAGIMRQYLFPPEGTRGMGYASRAGLWGTLPGGPAEYVRVGQQDVARIAMIEESESVEDIDGDIVLLRTGFAESWLASTPSGGPNGAGRPASTSPRTCSPGCGTTRSR